MKKTNFHSTGITNHLKKDKRPEPGEEAIKELNLEKEYSYIEK